MHDGYLLTHWLTPYWLTYSLTNLLTRQVVAKSCKMVPVMLMGYLVSGKRYTGLEYAMALAITSGAAIFKLNEVRQLASQ